MRTRVQVIGAQHASLAAMLAEAGTPVCLVISDPHDRARLQDLSARAGAMHSLSIVATAEGPSDLVLGCRDRVADAVSLDWLLGGTPDGAIDGTLDGAIDGSRGALAVHLTGRPGGPLLVEQIGTDPTGQIARLAREIGAGLITLPAGHVPPSARLSAALGLAMERLMLLGAAPAEIDAALLSAGWSIGPAEAQDLAGVDTALAARMGVHRHLGVADDLPLVARAVAEGRLGRKVGVGWYRYPGNGGKVEDPLVEDMATEEARFAGIEQSFPDAACIQRTVTEALDRARAGMPRVPNADIDLALCRAIGVPPGRL